MTKRISYLLTGALVLLAIAGAANAQVQIVTSNSAVTWDDAISWGSIPDGTGLNTPYSVTSTGGINTTVTNDAGFTAYTQSTSWSGCFNPGDGLLFNNFSDNPVTFSFGAGVYAVGTQVQTNDWVSYTAYLSAYDSSNNLLASYSVNGVANDNADGSAAFIGILSTDPNISQVVISATTGSGGFAVNSVLLQTQAAPVPEPGSLLALTTGIGTLAFFIRKRK
jgi:hypothetical protein